MKKLVISLFALFIALTVLPSAVMAQTDPPPRCCPINRAVPAPPGEADDTTMYLGQVAVSDAELALQGITRSQFIDRISETMFPGQTVDLVLSSADWALEPVDGAGDSLAVEEPYYFTVPRDAVASEDLDSAEQVILTDGSVYIEIIFTSGAL
jgi:hypothetical protein